MHVPRLLCFTICRRTWPPLIAVGGRSTQTLRCSSGQGGHAGHELKQLFVVQHPGRSQSLLSLLAAVPPQLMARLDVFGLIGGSANLAFREDEQLKPYKKKSEAVLLSAILDDSSFTIPAWPANAHPDISQVIRPECEVQDREECALPDTRLMDDTGSDMMTESMLTASSDIIVVDDLDDVHMLEHSLGPSMLSDTAGQTK